MVPPCTIKVAPPMTAPSGKAANIFLQTLYKPWKECAANLVSEGKRRGVHTVAFITAA